MDDAGAAAAARAVDVEERDTISLFQRGSIETTQRTTNGLECAGGYVTGDDRIGHATEASVPQVYVGAADLGSFRAQQRCTWGKVRSGKLTDVDRLQRRWHDSRKDAVAHIRTLPLIQLRFHRCHP